MGSTPGSGRSPGGGYDNPLEHPCLENPMDRGARRLTTHWAANSWIRLKQLRMHAYSATGIFPELQVNVISKLNALQWLSNTQKIRSKILLWGGVLLHRAPASTSAKSWNPRWPICFSTHSRSFQSCIQWLHSVPESSIPDFWTPTHHSSHAPLTGSVPPYLQAKGTTSFVASPPCPTLAPITALCQEYLCEGWLYFNWLYFTWRYWPYLKNLCILST